MLKLTNNKLNRKMGGEIKNKSMIELIFRLKPGNGEGIFFLTSLSFKISLLEFLFAFFHSHC